MPLKCAFIFHLFLFSSRFSQVNHFSTDSGCVGDGRSAALDLGLLSCFLDSASSPFQGHVVLVCLLLLSP
ncbi:hypothetical protein ATANTOWER_006031 [Ataeniobius toweri]|uniref:Secreted protein n=1 Tax=Ataeniobius toweri TaxID=208326 RepID=A0ABU7C0D4_9TELE|nr:hypothetical protein [Ataeniobius toweri]